MSVITMIEVGSPRQARWVAKSLAVSHVMVHVPTYLQLRKRGQPWAKKMRTLREAAKKLREDQTLVIRTFAVPSWIRGGNWEKRVNLLSGQWWDDISLHFDKRIAHVRKLHPKTEGCINAEIHGAAEEKGLDDIGDLGGLAAAITCDTVFATTFYAFAMPGRLMGGNRTFRKEQQSVIANLTGDKKIAGAYMIRRAKQCPSGSVVHLVIGAAPYETAVACGKWRQENPNRDVYFGPSITDSELKVLLATLKENPDD